MQVVKKLGFLAFPAVVPSTVQIFSTDPEFLSNYGSKPNSRRESNEIDRPSLWRPLDTAVYFPLGKMTTKKENKLSKLDRPADTFTCAPQLKIYPKTGTKRMIRGNWSQLEGGIPFWSCETR